MNTRRNFLAMCGAAALLLTAHVAIGAEPAATTISVQGMHCAGCAMKVAGNLKAVQGVSAAQVDAEKATAVITPMSAGNPSPRAMWEAIEKAGYKPTKLVGPAGTFTAKPKS